MQEKKQDAVISKQEAIDLLGMILVSNLGLFRDVYYVEEQNLIVAVPFRVFEDMKTDGIKPEEFIYQFQVEGDITYSRIQLYIQSLVQGYLSHGRKVVFERKEEDSSSTADTKSEESPKEENTTEQNE